MKTFIHFVLFGLLTAYVAEAQILKNAERAAKRGVERTVERRAEKEASQKTDEAIDKALGKKKKKKGNDPIIENPPPYSSEQSQSTVTTDPELNFSGTVFFQDDFNNTREGDFPGKFISNSGGEVVGLPAGNGLKFYPNSNVLPSLKNLPENFALEFDLTLEDVPPSLYNTFFNVYLQELQTLRHNDPKNKFGAFGFSLWGSKDNHQLDIFNAKASFEIKEKIPYNLLENVIDRTSKWVLLRNGNRVRMFINGKKLADSPNLLQGVNVQYINFRLNGTKKEDGHFVYHQQSENNFHWQ